MDYLIDVLGEIAATRTLVDAFWVCSVVYSDLGQSDGCGERRVVREVIVADVRRTAIGMCCRSRSEVRGQ